MSEPISASWELLPISAPLMREPFFTDWDKELVEQERNPHIANKPALIQRTANGALPTGHGVARKSDAMYVKLYCLKPEIVAFWRSLDETSAKKWYSLKEIMKEGLAIELIQRMCSFS